MELKRVVITGLGAITPIGKNVEDYWSALLAGVSGAAPITNFDSSKFKTKFACEVKDYDAKEYFDRKEARKHDRYAQFGLIASYEAIADSGLDSYDDLDKDRVGVIWASGIGGLNTFHQSVAEYTLGDGTPRFNPFFIPKMIADIAAGHISIKYGFRGPNFATVSACASSANALSDAYNYIRLGKANAFVTGGSEAAITESGVGGFNAMHAISTRNDDPKTASRPFDKDRDGFVMGEGGGGLVFEEFEHAKARGANIYAEVVGAGLSGDAHHMTAPHPEGYGAQLCMQAAIDDANLNIEDIDHINTHGTSTPVGDIVEPKAIVNLFGEHAYKINVNSTKSMTGHLLGGAGAVESISTILSVKNDIVPPTINHFTDDPEIDNNLNFTFHKAQKRTVNYGLTNTFGFGGHNASLIFKKFVK
ncbi:MAG: beta-ketoacyl-ACP synthase II [Bacteroidales bacterium]|jgi:3-oxoacyl-[acyl-carrier-protein] synthase II|nr:beta-ketoacyl-[acyl-carrier-protein] synthase II [Lentimicrobiaceae bacterium]MDG1135401.1 beta-ketoacyl-ACP synthase II [Bacteroidales bacterium]MDG1902476.1 beta-ketoacyl-ACP synthase II [Bacteroidales bacterium]MDG2081946.1 beta-ketoacyl-ACP synthase II [Bacteroidales bacterium]|tara:strand:- start:10365 stop:11621 length:1257 start_codon:yes stop_codon:yes gene_type:complete